MARINKTVLTAGHFDLLLKQCAQAIAPANSKQAKLVLTELLGYEEQVMVAKRMAAIVLLAEGMSNYKIGTSLKLSQSTVATIQRKLKSGEYQTLIKSLERDKQDYWKLLDTLDSLLHLGGILPHYNGLDRYKFMK
jgi:uncharacterized protein YerC